MPTRVPWNAYRVEGATAILEMRDGCEACINLEDLERISDFDWLCLHKDRPNKRTGVYVYRRGYREKTLHRVIMDAPRGVLVDHINHDGLDNRKANLRLVTNQENMQNRNGPNSNSKSGVRGVSRFCIQGREYWGLRIWLGENHPSGKKSFMKYYPYTPEGLADATEAAPRLRAELMTHAEPV